MAKLFEIYKCEACGNIAEVIHGGAATLNCCGKSMKLMVENSVDASKEKHVPVIEKIATGIKVKVGSVPHPMEEKHYIEWVEVFGEKGMAYMHFFKAGEKSEVDFYMPDQKVTVRAYCNLHGLWKSSQ